MADGVSKTADAIKWPSPPDLPLLEKIADQILVAEFRSTSDLIDTRAYERSEWRKFLPGGRPNWARTARRLLDPHAPQGESDAKGAACYEEIDIYASPRAKGWLCSVGAMYSPEEGSCEFIFTSSLRRQRGHVAVHAVCPFEARGSAAGFAVSRPQRSRGSRTEPTTPQLGKTELFGHRTGCFALSEMHRSWRSVLLNDRRMEESGPPGGGARRFRSLGISIMRQQSSRQLEGQQGLFRPANEGIFNRTNGGS